MPKAVEDELHNLRGLENLLMLFIDCAVDDMTRTRFNFSAAGQNSYVVQQILGRDFQAALGGSGLQVFKRKASPPNYFLPEMDPTKTEPAPAVVKYPSLARYNGLRFTVRQCH